MKKFYVYLARCNDQSLYCGYTIDLESREATHNTGKGSAYTRSRLPIVFIYHEVFDTKSEAMKREFAIKKLSKSEKEALVST